MSKELFVGNKMSGKLFGEILSLVTKDVFDEIRNSLSDPLRNDYWVRKAREILNFAAEVAILTIEIGSSDFELAAKKMNEASKELNELQERGRK